MNTTIRRIDIPFDKYEITGLCICYDDKESAQNFFNKVHEYLMAPSGTYKSTLVVSFKNISNGGYKFYLTFSVGEYTANIVVESVDSEHVFKLQKSLEIFSNYFIVCGYGHGSNFDLLPVDKYHLFKSAIIIDDEIVEGENKVKVDWHQLLTSGDKSKR